MPGKSLASFGDWRFSFYLDEKQMRAFYLSLFVNLFVLFFSEFTETYLLACLVDYFDNNPDFKRSVMLDLDMLGT